jgi:hypothetical protein
LVDQLSRANDAHVGFDQAFEVKWARFERIVWALMALAILAGLLGLLGRGPMNSVVRRSGGLEVKYDRLARYRSPAITEVTLASTAGAPPAIRMTGSCMKNMQVQFIMPMPAQQQPLSDGTVFVFAGAGSGTGKIRFAEQAGKVGPSKCRIEQVNGPAVDLNQFVLP